VKYGATLTRLPVLTRAEPREGVAPDEFGAGRRSYGQDMTRVSPDPVVHLELHTGDLPRASAFYGLLFGWRPERIEAAGSRYWALDLGGEGLGGGVVECGTPRPLWLPYVEVDDVAGATERARRLGAWVTLEPREGPAGWRSVVAAPAAGEVAFWQPKDPRGGANARAERAGRAGARSA
jgi:predicted enzyme related to lactoylglutathione lyase